MFQSTLPRGERHPAARTVHRWMSVSIHAPAWGATSYLYWIKSSWRFQSTLPRGERRSVCSRLCACLLFQSTLPRGERLRSLLIILSYRVFQSTLPRGERLFAPCTSTIIAHVSIHAPAWGATWAVLGKNLNYRCFNPRSRVGSDS